eukprot:TRINITY_DN1069_c0_g1_i1.p1 TRINITY_DN1069_c0_g1~~TRINITY_DN1069_c0_g1_i1.p1  ORF type:complete len:2760 (+),score=837.80 TRINITY_DN1069_c0_g1_i1:89-8368(+)
MMRLLVLLLLIVVSEAAFRRRNDPGYALHFTGPQRSTLNLPPISFGAPLTFEFLLRPTFSLSYIVPETTILYFKAPSTNQVNIKPSTVEITWTATTQIKVKHTNTAGQTSVVSSLAASVAYNVWNYVVVTIDSSGNVNIFADGDNNSTQSIVTGNTKLSNGAPQYTQRKECYIGNNPNVDTAFNGDIDEVRIWKTVLPTSQMYMNRVINDRDANLIAFWNFDEGSGFTANDLSASNYLASIMIGTLRVPGWILSSPEVLRSCSIYDFIAGISFDRRVFLLELWRTGEYWLSHSSDSQQSGNVSLAIQARIGICNWIFPCLNGLAFSYGSDSVVIDADFSKGAKDSTVSVNRVLNNNDYIQQGAISILKSYGTNEQSYDIVIAGALRMTFKAFPRLPAATINLKVPEKRYLGTGLKGICGNLNNNAGDDGYNAAWVVSQSESIFQGTYSPPVTIPTGVSCAFDALSPDLRIPAQLICSNVNIVGSDPSIQAACRNAICIAGSLSGALPFAYEHYFDCASNWTSLPSNQTNTLTPPNCQVPCPNFCSWNGICQNGACVCNATWTGNDCSQRSQYPCYQAAWDDTGISYDMTPVAGTNTVVQHYAYSSSTSSGNTGNEISDSIVMYLYEQPAFNLKARSVSLVMVIDKQNDGTGGQVQVKMTYTGTPSDFSGLQIAVQDDPARIVENALDTYQLGNYVFSGSWKWDACCTDGMAISGIPTNGNDFNFNINFTKLSGISQVVVASPNLFQEQDLYAMSSGNATNANLVINGTTCYNYCGSYATCFDCAADERCGWCVDTSTCESGSAGGPDNGYCSVFRYSTLPGVSKVTSSTAGYPVTPSAATAYVSQGSDLAPKIWVTVPRPQDVPLDILLLMDVSANNAYEIAYIKAQILGVYNQLTTTYPYARIGFATFSDKPISPYGKAQGGDVAYKLNMPLTNNRALVQQGINAVTMANGGDPQNSQLEAVLQASLRDEVNWNTAATKVIAIVTKTGFHVGNPNQPLPGLVPNNGDNVMDPNEDYPSIAQVKNALLTRNVVPMFIVSNDQVNAYANLVKSIGFGYVRIQTAFVPVTIVTESLAALATVFTNPKAVAEDGSAVVSIYPPLGYTGLSPLSRVRFDVHLDPNAPTDAVSRIVVPGFGFSVISNSEGDFPVPDSCPDTDTDSDTPAVLYLTGKSSYSIQVAAWITQFPDNGKLYQYGINGTRGPQITPANYRVTDFSNRVIYVPPLEGDGQDYDSVSYKLSDACGLCSLYVTTCNINVHGVTFPTLDPTPVVANTTQGTPIPIYLQAINTSYPYVAVIVQVPGKGYLVLPDGTPLFNNAQISDPSMPVIYRPPPTGYGMAPFYYYDAFFWRVETVNSIQTNTAIYRIAVTPVNTPPNATDRYPTVDQRSVNNPIYLLGKDQETPDQLTYFVSAGNQGGIVTLANNTAGLVYYTPSGNFNGTESFTYYVEDADGLMSNTATVWITVKFLDRDPTAFPSTVTLNENDTITFNLNATDADLPNDMLTYYLINWNGKGTLSNNNTVVSKGTAEYPIVGNTLTYSPVPYMYGTAYDTLTFRVRDSHEGNPSTAIVTINVNAVQFPPVVSAQNQPLSLQVNSSSTVTLYATDYDPEDNVTFTVCSLPTKGSLTYNGVAVQLNTVILGTKTNSFNSQASLTYSVGLVGNTSDTFSVSAVYATAPCVVYNIVIVSSPPVATGAVTSPVTNEDTGLAIQLGGNAVDPPLSFYITELPLSTRGTLYQGRVSGGQAILSVPTNLTDSGHYVYFMPAPNYNGNEASFKYQIMDNHRLYSQQSQVSIQVIAVNDPPTATPWNVPSFGQRNNSGPILLRGSDIDSSTLYYSIVTPPTNGSLAVCASNSDCSTPTAIVSYPSANLGSQTVVYTPSFRFVGADSFVFKVSDGQLNATASVTIMVTPDNRAPIANGVTLLNVTDEANVYYNYSLSGYDPDGDSISAIIDAAPSRGSLYQNYNGAPGALITDGTPVDGWTVWYLPQLQTGDSSQVFATFSYMVQDSFGSQSAPVTVNVYNYHKFKVEPPTPLTTAASGNAGTNVAILLQGSSGDNTNTTNFVRTITFVPAVGTLSQSSGTIISANNTVVTDPQGYVYFRLSGNTYGSTNFGYTLSQNNLTSNQSVVSVQVDAVLTAPRPNLPNLNGVEDTPLFITLTYGNANEIYPNDQIMAYIVSAPDALTRGTLYQVNDNGSPNLNAPLPANTITRVTNKNYTIYWVPSPNVFATATFTYFMNESLGGLPKGTPTSNQYQVNIFIQAVNDPPVVQVKEHLGQSNIPQTLLDLSYSDPDGPCYQPDGTCPVTACSNLTGGFTTLPTKGKLYKGAVTAANLVTLGTTFRCWEYDFTYVTNVAGAYGVRYDSFVYYITDQINTTSAINYITINYVNNPPNATSSTTEVQLAEGTTSPIFSITAQDDGPITGVSLTITSIPNVGSLYQILRDGSSLLVQSNGTQAASGFNNGTWLFRYTPPAGFNTWDYTQGLNVPQRMTYSVADDINVYASPNPIQFIVTRVNQPPNITGYEAPITTKPYYLLSVYYAPKGYPSNQPTYYGVQCHPNNKNGFSISDDGNPTSGNYELTVTTLPRGQMCDTLMRRYVFIRPVTGVTLASPDGGNQTLVITGTLNNINAALNVGIRAEPWFRPDPSVFAANLSNCYITLTIKDFGNGGDGTPSAIQYNITKQFRLNYGGTVGSTGPPAGAGGAVTGLVGVTSLLSLALFGGYRIMKKKKIIPENVDPWENDEIFNATQDNPLFATGPAPLPE